MKIRLLGRARKRISSNPGCANHSDEPLKAKIMSAEASIIFESPRHGTTIEFEHLYLSHLSFNFTGGNFFSAGEMLASVKIDKENR